MKRLGWQRTMTLFVFLVTLGGISVASEPGSDPRAPDPVQQFLSMQRHGDPLAFWLGVGSDPRTCKHYQGLARAAGPGTPYFFLTRSGNQTGGCAGASDDPGELLVVEMGSRNKIGERLRSNLLFPGQDIDYTAPPFADIGVKSIRFNGASGWPKYSHLGGVQLVDGVLVVPLEKRCPGYYEDGGTGDCSESLVNEGAIALVGVSQPDSPSILKVKDLHADYGWPEDRGLGVVGVLYVHQGENPRTATEGRYLFALTWGNSTEVLMGWSTTTELNETTDITLDHYWHEDYLGGHSGKWRNWQTLNFVRGTDGSVYLIGAEKAAGSTANDWIGMFRVDLTKVTGDFVTDAISYVGEKNLFLSRPNMGSLDAASGIYVSPTGQMIFYTAPHDNDAPGGSVEMGEFRSIYVSHTKTCGPQFRSNHLGGPYLIPEASELQLDGEVYFIQPWVHMFEETSFSLYDEGTSLMLDYQDQALDDHYRNFRDVGSWSNNSSSPGFNDALDSFTFCGSAGSDLFIYDDDSFDPGGNHGYIKCEGSGTVIAVPNFTSSPRPSVCAQYLSGSWSDFNDEATSARIAWDPPSSTYTWSLQGDQVGTLIPLDLPDHEEGSQATYEAGAGSSTDIVTLEVWGDERTATIEVYNVPPSVDDLSLSDNAPDEGQEVTISGDWTDPGAVEAVVTIDWGDATQPEQDAGNAGAFTFSHRYGDDGTFDGTVCVDDGEDATCSDFSVAVSNVAPTIDALPSVTADEYELHTYTGHGTDPGSDDLTFIWQWGDGTPDTVSIHYANGTSPDPFPSPQVNPRDVSDGAVHAYDDEGIYTLTLTVEDDDGGTDSVSTAVRVLNMDPVFSIYSMQFAMTLSGGATLRPHGVYDSEGGIGHVVDPFLPSTARLDAVDLLPGGNLLFSVDRNRGAYHAGGFISLKHDRVYEYDVGTGEIRLIINWSDWGINVGSLDALDRLEDGSVAFSTAGTRGVTHAGGYTVVRPENAYRFDPVTGVIDLLFDGRSLRLSDLDALHVLADGRVAFSIKRNRLVRTGSGSVYVRHQQVYLWNGEELRLLLDGVASKIGSIDAASLGVP